MPAARAAAASAAPRAAVGLACTLGLHPAVAASAATAASKHRRLITVFRSVGILACSIPAGPLPAATSIQVRPEETVMGNTWENAGKTLGNTSGLFHRPGVSPAFRSRCPAWRDTALHVPLL